MSMKKIALDKTFTLESVGELKSLIGKKLLSIHHDEFLTGNLSIQKVGIFADDQVYVLTANYEETDFLWGKEGVTQLRFGNCREEELVVKAVPPIKYVNEKINARIRDIWIIRDSIEEFNGRNSMGKFVYDKGIVLILDGKQVGIWLDSWMGEIFSIVRSKNALEKMQTIEQEWSNKELESEYHFEVKRTFLPVGSF